MYCSSHREMANILYQNHFLPAYKSPLMYKNSDGSADIAGSVQGAVLHAYNYKSW